jgi:hypothetical protein
MGTVMAMPRRGGYGLLNSNGGPIKDIHVQGLPLKQNHNASFVESPFEGEPRFHSGGFGNLNYSKQSFENRDAVVVGTNGYTFSYSFPQALPQGTNAREAFTGLDIAMDCSVSAATFVKELEAREGASLTNEYERIQFVHYDDDSPAAAWGVNVLGNARRLAFVDTRWALNTQWKPNTWWLQQECLYHTGCVALCEQSTGRLLLPLGPFSYRPHTEDATRYHTCTFTGFEAPAPEDEAGKQALERFKTDPSGFKFNFIVVRMVDRFSVPIHLTAEDLQRAFPITESNAETTLTLHFNSTTQRWEPISQP